jgi:putative nucleotidyltransferase with HDIG domain
MQTRNHKSLRGNVMSSDKLSMAQTILKTFVVLPTVPAAAARAMRLLDEDDTDMEQVADILLSDQVMTARIIRIINSPLYKTMHEIGSIKQALVFLGSQKIFEIILTSCFMELTDSKLHSALRVQSCWEHSFGVGLVAKRMAEAISYPNPERAYVAGILHDIGKVILSQHRRQEFVRAIVLAQENEQNLYEAEIEVFGTSHAEVGGVLAEQWSFPAEFVDVIQHHHYKDFSQLTPLALMVALADNLCVGIGLTCTRDQDDPHILGCAQVVELLRTHLPRIGACDIDKFVSSLVGMTDEVRSTVQTIYA